MTGLLRIGLVACAKTKLDHPAPARELYTSPLFRSARNYCEAHYDVWYVLSAKHGAVPPEAELAPYDQALGDLPPEARWAWGQRVGADLRRRHPGAQDWYLHAGKVYRRPLQHQLHGLIEVPLQGRGIGEQLHWYRLRARGLAAGVFRP